MADTEEAGLGLGPGHRLEGLAEWIAAAPCGGKRRKRGDGRRRETSEEEHEEAWRGGTAAASLDGAARLRPQAEAR